MAKRSDIPTDTVLRTIHEHGFNAFERLEQRFPAKVVLAAFARDDDRGLIEYGTTLRRPWLTPEGRAAIDETCAPPDGFSTATIAALVDELRRTLA